MHLQVKTGDEYSSTLYLESAVVDVRSMIGTNVLHDVKANLKNRKGRTLTRQKGVELYVIILFLYTRQRSNQERKQPRPPIRSCSTCS